MVVTDDLKYAKSIMPEDVKVEYITWNTGTDSYKDMQLMSLCKHNIIANSSFSWWAAWLNKNPDKIVVMPKQWYKGQSYNPLAVDGWIMM